MVAARRALIADESVLSVAQLGTRLHVLIDPTTLDPAGRVLQRLGAASVAAQSTLVRAKPRGRLRCRLPGSAARPA